MQCTSLPVSRKFSQQKKKYAQLEMGEEKNG